MSRAGIMTSAARRLLAAAGANVNVNSSDATSAANIRIVVRSAYSGSRAGSSETAVASGLLSGATVPCAAPATAAITPKTHRMAAISHRLGNRLAVARAGKLVLGMPYDLFGAELATAA